MPHELFMLCCLIITIVHMMLVPSCFITCRLLLTVHFVIGCLHFLITKLLRYIKSYYILSSALHFASTVFLNMFLNLVMIQLSYWFALVAYYICKIFVIQCSNISIRIFYQNTVFEYSIPGLSFHYTPLELTSCFYFYF